MTQATVILLNGLPVTTTYMANCRLCLGTNFGERSTTIVEEHFGTMLAQVFSFPIPNHIGLPMNVCSKCRKGVELFFRYTRKVQMNQKKLEQTFISNDYQQTGKIGVVSQEKLQHSYANQVQEISNVVEIDSDSEFQKAKDDNVIDVDMQCELVTDNGENIQNLLVQPSSYDNTQEQFVSQSDVTDSTTKGRGRNKKRGTKPVAEPPLVIEIISLSDEECEESAVGGARKSQCNVKRKKFASQNRQPLSKPRSSERTISQGKAAAPTVNNLNNLDIAIDSLVGGVTMVYYEEDVDKEMDGATASSSVAKCTKSAPYQSKYNMRSKINEPNAKRPTQELKSVRRSRK